MMSDTDPTFNFLISLIYSQLFNLLCEKADDVYGDRLPVHVRCLIDEAASRQYLQDLYNSVELKDIVKRNRIRDVDMLERIIAYITSNIGTTFSSTAISKYLKSEGRSVSTDTVLNYIKACTDAFLFYQVKRQDLQGKKILTINEKYYVADHGVREAVFGENMRDINLVPESIVYMDFLLSEEWN